MRRSPSSSTSMYSALGSTAAPVFDGRVHGVVVHTTSEAPISEASSASLTGNRRNTLGSSTVWYPMATSASDSAVPQRGQYAVTLSASCSRPRSKSERSDHHTDSTYSVSIVQYASSRSTQYPIRSVSRSNSPTYRFTEARQRSLNSAIPNASMSRLPVVPISFSTSSSTGRPWQSQPPLRGTRCPVIVLNRGKTSLNVRGSTWCTPGLPFAVGGPS